jgi:hypothetical protein
VTSPATGVSPTPATAVVMAVEYVNYGSKSSTQFISVTRGQAGNSSLALTVASGSNSATVSSAAGLQIGQRVISTAFPESTYISAISGTTLTLSQAASSANPTVVVVPMGLTTGSNGATTNTGQAFSYATTAPTAVEFAYPTFAPSISHWGTSVIMDGRYDDDKSLLFTYGQKVSTALQGAVGNVTVTFQSGGASGTNTITLVDITQLVVGMTVVSGVNIAAGTAITAINPFTKTVTLSANFSAQAAATYVFTATSVTKALFAVRVAPSVDNGVPAAFGARELINRMQLVLRGLDVTAAAPAGNTAAVNILLTAVLNGVPSTTLAWTNAVGNVAGVTNSSLAQIADYGILGSTGTTISGGEQTGGFFTSGTTSLDLNQVRDLGNAILGGGSANSNAGIYPDGPDTLTIVAQNLSSVPVSISGRLSWTEAQA